MAHLTRDQTNSNRSANGELFTREKAAYRIAKSRAMRRSRTMSSQRSREPKHREVFEQITLEDARIKARLPWEKNPARRVSKESAAAMVANPLKKNWYKVMDFQGVFGNHARRDRLPGSSTARDHEGEKRRKASDGETLQWRRDSLRGGITSVDISITPR